MSAVVAPSGASVQVAGHVVDLGRRLLLDASGRPVDLRPQALALLCLLAERAGEVVDRHELLERIWPGVVVTDDSLVQAVGDVRRSLGDLGHHSIQTVPRRGYRLIADATPPDSAAEPAPLVTSAWRPPRLRLWVALVATALLGLFAIGWAWRGEPPHVLTWLGTTPASYALPAVDRLNKPAIAVLAFRDETPGARDALLGQGMAEDLVADMARDIDLPVVSARSSFALDGQRLSAVEMAQRLKVRYLVDGSVQRNADRLKLQVQLIDGGSGRVVWTDASDAGVERLAEQRAALLARIGGSIASTMRWNQKQLAVARPAATLDVYALTMRGYADKHLFTAKAYRDGRAVLEQALRVDPQYAPAWAILGYLNGIDVGLGITGEWGFRRYPEALAQIDKAIQLDPTLPIAYQARATTLSSMQRPVEALAAAETSVKLAPGDADNRAVLARTLAQVGRLAEARQVMDSALVLYPIAPSYVGLWDGEVRWAERDFDRALGQSRYCLDRAPKLLKCRITLAVTLFETGRLEEARTEAAAIRSQMPGANANTLISSFAGVPELRERRLKAALVLGFPAGG